MPLRRFQPQLYRPSLSVRRWSAEPTPGLLDRAKAGIGHVVPGRTICSGRAGISELIGRPSISSDSPSITAPRHRYKTVPRRARPKSARPVRWKCDARGETQKGRSPPALLPMPWSVRFLSYGPSHRLSSMYSGTLVTTGIGPSPGFAESACEYRMCPELSILSVDDDLPYCASAATVKLVATRRMAKRQVCAAKPSSFQMSLVARPKSSLG